MQNNKLGWFVFAVVVLAIAATLVTRKGADEAPLVSLSPTASPSPTKSVVAKPASTPHAGTTSSYSAALKQYANSRIQFDMYCQASPSRSSFPSGVSVMLDNRSGDARTIAVGGVQYKLTGYGWKVITLIAKTAVDTLYIDCGSARNVGTILVQK